MLPLARVRIGFFDSLIARRAPRPDANEVLRHAQPGKSMADSYVEEHEPGCQGDTAACFGEWRYPYSEEGVLKDLEEIAECVHGHADRGCHLGVIDDTAGLERRKLDETAECAHIPDDVFLPDFILDIKIGPRCQRLSPGLPSLGIQPGEASEQQAVFQTSLGKSRLGRQGNRQEDTRPALGLHDGSEGMCDASARKEIGASSPESARGAAGKYEVPSGQAL